MANDFVSQVEDLTVADDATVSAGFQVPKWAIFCGVWLVDCDAADVGIQICDTESGTYVPIIDITDGDDLIIVASGADPCWVDFSDFVRAVPYSYWLQLTFSAAQSGGPYTHKLFFRG